MEKKNWQSILLTLSIIANIALGSFAYSFYDGQQRAQQELALAEADSSAYQLQAEHTADKNAELIEQVEQLSAENSTLKKQAELAAQAPEEPSEEFTEEVYNEESPSETYSEPASASYYEEPVEEYSEPQGQTVYVTNTGSKYHQDGCRYLSKSKIPISLDDAISSGYEPCSKCN